MRGNAPRRSPTYLPGQDNSGTLRISLRGFNLIPKMSMTWPTRNTVSGDTRGHGASTPSSTKPRLSPESEANPGGATQRFSPATMQPENGSSLHWDGAATGKSGLRARRRNRQLTAATQWTDL